MNVERVNYLIHNPTSEVDDTEILDIYKYRCVVCRNPTHVIHEITPRSILPFVWRRWINRVLLCVKCHDEAHKHGTISSRDNLIACRNQRLGEYWNIWI